MEGEILRSYCLSEESGGKLRGYDSDRFHIKEVFMKYSIELLDETTKLVSIIEQQLNCSFDEACEVMKTIFRKINNDEIKVDNSLKLLLPDFLQQVRDADATLN